MPIQSKAVDKFQLITILSIIIKAIEDDRIKAGKVSFSQTKTGVFNVSIFHAEK